MERSWMSCVHCPVVRNDLYLRGKVYDEADLMSRHTGVVVLVKV